MFESLIHAARQPAAEAFRSGDRSYSYRAMAEDIARCAAWLAKQKVPAGSPAVLHVADPYFHWILFFALEAAGIVSVPEWIVTRIDAAYLERVGAKLVFSSGPDPRLPGVKWIAVGPAFRTAMRAFRPRPPAPRKLASDQPVCVVLSSGTTGAAKKVLLTRELLDRRTTHARDAEFLRAGARLACLLPYPSIGGILAALQTWLVGGTLVHAVPDTDWAGELSAGRIDNLVATPFHLEAVLKALPEAMPRPAALTVLCGGATPSRGLRERLTERLTDDIIVAYGTTETGLVTKGQASAGSDGGEVAGAILPWMRVEAIGEDGAPVPLGTPGEIRVAGEDVVAGYFDSPEETARYFRDGWYHPGDVGIVEANGQLVVTGRVDDLINLGGRKVLPSAVEAVARKFPGVTDAAAISIPGADGTAELWIAYCAAAPIDAARVRQVLAEFPRLRLARVAAIPRNPMGKIEREALRAKAASGELDAQPEA